MTICRNGAMQTNAVLASIAIAAAAATNAPPSAVKLPAVAVATAEVDHPTKTNLVEDVASTNVVMKATATDVVPVKVIYPDVASGDFSMDEWAEELAEGAEQGLHVKNGQVLVVVRVELIDGEYQALTKVRAKFRAIEFLRYHYQDLPSEFSAPCRILSCDLDDEKCVAVVAFRLKDLK